MALVNRVNSTVSGNGFMAASYQSYCARILNCRTIGVRRRSRSGLQAVIAACCYQPFDAANSFSVGVRVVKDYGPNTRFVRIDEALFPHSFRAKELTRGKGSRR